MRFDMGRSSALLKVSVPVDGLSGLVLPVARPMSLRLVPILIFSLLLLAASLSAQDEPPRNRFSTDILADTFGFDESTPGSVDLEELYQGCPRRDCIPSIDAPKFEDASSASAWLADDELVLAIVHDGAERAYPVRILDRHEIVNDRIGGDPVAVTWCPLCGSGVAFAGQLDGEAVEFGVSGLLHGSDLVMYDRRSETLWQQITGEAVLGPLHGRRLESLPLTITRWGRWKTAHPQTRVLSKDTGTDYDYFANVAYGGYEESDRLMFPATHRDLSIHPKTVVFGFDIDGQTLAVLAPTLDTHDDRLESRLGERQLTIERQASGAVTATDETGRVHHSTRLFWFAWYNFNPETARL
jgi:hypothetical protein